MSPTDPHEQTQRLPAFAKDEGAERFFEAVNDAVATARLPSPGVSEVDRLGLVYVVGVPRSGTTLVHQLLAGCLDIGYVDNIAARFWARPSIGLALSSSVIPMHERRIELASAHGLAAGAAGPHEFGYFWRRWLQLDDAPTHHLDDEALARVDVEGLRTALREELLGTCGRSVVLKNLVCGFHARYLTALHPRSLFVQVERDEETTARSILAVRRER
jgi:hypothetical protein